MSLSNQDFMQVAIALARSSLTKTGQRPFAAVVVRNGEIIGTGINRVEALSDPTAHGEVEAVRDACRTHGPDLSGCDVYTTCEPCIMCVASMEVAGISRIFYGASMQSAGKVMAPIRPDFVNQFKKLRETVCTPLDRRAIPAIQEGEEEALAVLADWTKLKLVGAD